MSANSLYDDWDWTEETVTDEEERYQPDRPEDEEFYWAERLKSMNDAKEARANAKPEPGFLKIWDGEGQTRPLVTKRSDGYKQPIGTVARVPSVPSNPQTPNPYQSVQNAPYQNSYSQPQPQSQQQPTYPRPPMPNMPNLVKASSLVPQSVQQPIPQQAPYYPQTYYPQQTATVQLPTDASYVTYKDIENGTYFGDGDNIPIRPKATGPMPDSRPRLKVTRQFFLALLALDIANARDPSEIKKLGKRLIEHVIPQSDADNEVCLYNAEELVSQLITQMVSTREEAERISLFEIVQQIFDLYLPSEVAAKEFIRANNSTYPHPAYVGLQASLDMLNYLAIWSANLRFQDRSRNVPVGELIDKYLVKYRSRLNRLPVDIGKGNAKTIYYYE